MAMDINLDIRSLLGLCHVVADMGKALLLYADSNGV